MTFKRKKLGSAGEELAAQFLLQKGYRILARNLKTEYGEMDIIAALETVTVFVEVKTKTSTVYGVPAEMVTARKQEKLRLLATLYATAHQLTDYRIDVIAIDVSAHPPTIEHLIAAV